MYMKIKQLIKMVKADTKKFLKSKDGKNYIQLIFHKILIQAIEINDSFLPKFINKTFEIDNFKKNIPSFL